MVAVAKDQDDSSVQTKYLSDYKPTDFVIESVKLHFDLFEAFTRVHSEMQFTRNAQVQSHVQNLHLDGEDLELESVQMNGHELAPGQYELIGGDLVILSVPDSFVLKTVVRIKPQENTELMGLYKSSGNFCTQCESEGFRRITYFYDRPDVMSVFTTSISADKDKYPMLLSNGNLVAKKELADGRHYVEWHDPSLKPCYLFALVAGHFDYIEDHFVTMSGRKVTLAFYVERGFKDQGYFAVDALKRSMTWDEQTFGREYDLDIYMVVAVGDFNMGAMENKGLNVFNTKYVLAKSDTATDMDFYGIDRVIGHEYFHNWSGNRVTCRDWFQLTLKEGLTVLREQLFCEAVASPAMVRIDNVNKIRTLQFAQDAGPMSHPIRPEQYMEINNFYTITVYEKGSEVIRMVRTFLGEQKFRAAMDLYFSRHDGQAVTTEDFIKAMADSSGFDFEQFCLWYRQAGTPILHVTKDYDADAQTLTLTVKQTVPATPGQDCKQMMQMPLSIGFVNEQGDVPTQLQSETQAQTGTRVLDINAAENAFTFVNVTREPALSLLREFSAPVKLDYAYSDVELLTLIRHDSDAFARWDAAQSYFSQVMLQWIPVWHQHPESAFSCDQALIDTFKALLQDGSQDPELLSMLCVLPTEAYMMEMMPVADVDAVHHVRGCLMTDLATRLSEQWQALYQRLNTGESYQYNALEMGKRSLKNVALMYLLAADAEQYAPLAKTQYEQADNMTDKIGAIRALNQQDSSVRTDVLQDFYQSWQHEPLVLDKWFAVNANARFGDVIARIQSLAQDPKFDLLNPNKVRALYGAFCQNLSGFHRADGAGYQLLADTVLALDTHNRLTAARMCEPLIRWKKLDVHRQALMKQQLERIMAAPNLSKDVYEMVSKSLNL